jgi:hypothetical protein
MGDTRCLSANSQHSLLHRRFNLKYNPCGSSRLREIFLKTVCKTFVCAPVAMHRVSCVSKYCGEILRAGIYVSVCTFMCVRVCACVCVCVYA